MMKSKIHILIACIAVTCLVLTIAPASAMSQDPQFVQILEVDKYNKNAERGGNAVYNWTLTNIDASDLVVSIRASVYDSGWKCEVTPGSLAIPSGSLSSVTTTVTAPTTGTSTYSNVTIVFEIYKKGYLVQVNSFNVFTTLAGMPLSSDKVLGLFDNPLPQPLHNEWGVFLLDVVLWLAIALVVTYLMNTIIRRMTRRTATMIDNIILDIIRTPIILLVLAYGTISSLAALHTHVSADVISLLFSIYKFILVLVVFYLAYKLFKEIVLHYGRMVAKKTASKVDDVLVPVVEKIGVVIIAFAGLIYALDAFHVDLTVFVAGGVVVSMVLAFAAQETISNFFSGIFLLLDRPFKEGDTVILSDGDWCEVRRIGLRTTRLLRFSDASMVSIPNNQLVNDKLARMTDVSDPARVMIDVGVAYGTDPTKARDAILSAIRENPQSLLTDPDKQPLILFDKMGDSALIFVVSVWLKDRDKRIAARDSLVEGIYRKLSEVGIDIPFPQRVVHIKKIEEKEQRKGLPDNKEVNSQ